MREEERNESKKKLIMRPLQVLVLLAMLLRHCAGSPSFAAHKFFPRRSVASDEAANERGGWRTECPEKCRLELENGFEVEKNIRSHIEKQGKKVVLFKIELFNYTVDVLETYPYMATSYLASLWTLALGELGRKLLELPLDSDVLSFYLINLHDPIVSLPTTSHPHHCLVSLSPRCRLTTVRNYISSIIKALELHGMSPNLENSRHKRLCHYLMHNTNENTSRLSYKCCHLEASLKTPLRCEIIFIDNNQEILLLKSVIEFLSFLITLYSPFLVLSIKSALSFDHSSKFFRASLKHGITGQRNYVIRISYRQMINLNDPSPFSLPRAALRLVCHCYGEGRCCIHCWGHWPHQPCIFSVHSKLKKFWFLFLKILGVLILYPCVIHMSLLLYFPKLQFYQKAMQHSSKQEHIHPLDLSLHTIGSYLVTKKDMFFSLWMLFASLSFIYVTTLLSWPQYPLEKCLLKQRDRKPENSTKVLQNKFSRSYKAILFEMSYGQDSNDYRHFVKLPFFPFQLKRIVRCLWRGLAAYVPIINTCTHLLQAPVNTTPEQPHSGSESQKSSSKRTHSAFINCTKKSFGVFLYVFVGTGFSLILMGYCSIVFVISDFLLNVIFFLFIATLIYPLSLLPCFFCLSSVLYYANESLRRINEDHRFILKLIDENSPRLSARERTDVEEESTSVSRILKSHNLGAVKFVDSDGSEYVSKELYYAVSADLKSGFGRSVRRLLRELSTSVLFFGILFVVLKIVIFFTESVLCAVICMLAGGLMPKICSIKCNVEKQRGENTARKEWSKRISEVLDKHIRVDLQAAALDEGEEHLSTYDVRPVGVLEMELPKELVFRSLKVWKYPWTVSCEQQCPTNEAFMHVLSARIASVSFVSRMLAKGVPGDFNSEGSLKCWSLLVENCILEASCKILNLQGTPFIDTYSLFSSDVQPLVTPFESGTTVDALVDSVNCELYGFCVLAVIASINNMTCVIVKLRSNRLLAFNASCHGEHMPDFFGALLITADFNAQNLQLMIKYLLEPQRPDSVPVYEELTSQAVVIRSPDIQSVESTI